MASDPRTHRWTRDQLIRAFYDGYLGSICAVFGAATREPRDVMVRSVMARQQRPEYARLIVD